MAELCKIIKKPEFIKRNGRKEEHLMKLLFQSDSTRLLSIKFLALLFSIALGSSVVLAGGMPPDVEKEAMMEQSAEAEETSTEAKETSSEVKEEPSTEVKDEAVAEQSPDSAEPSTELVKEMPEVKEDLPATTSGFSLGVRGALSILNSGSVSGASVQFGGSQYGPLEGTVDYDKGYGFSFLLGYALGNGLRLESEAGYMNNGFQGINVETSGALQLEPGENELEGDLSALTLMMNAYYDIDFGGNLVPYIGGGLGAADLSNEMKSGGTTVGSLLVDDSDYVFIYQVGAGLGYKLNRFSNGPDVTVSLDYRYLASFEDPRFKEKVTGNLIEGEFGGHYIGGGVRLGLW